MINSLPKAAALLLSIILALTPVQTPAYAQAKAEVPVSLSVTSISPSGKSLIDPVTEVLRGKSIQLAFKINKKCNIRLTILDQSGKTVRTITKTGVAAGSGTIQWDGKAAGGKAMAYATFTFSLTATPADKNSGAASTVKQTVLVRAKAAATIKHHPSVLYVPRDKLVFDFTYNTRGKAFVSITKNGVSIAKSSFIVYAHEEGKAEAMFYSWDMKKDNGSVAEAGKYVVTLTVKNGVSSSTKSFTMEVRKMRS